MRRVAGLSDRQKGWCNAPEQDMEGRRYGVAMNDIRKAEPAPDYPPEEGCYLRGNDFSPVAVVVILKWRREETPPQIELLVRTAVESGAALAGTLQTENIGLEKVISNLVSNPNIRYLIVFGPESPGHLVGDAIVALAKNGVDAGRRIVGAKAPTPYLFNIPHKFVERFREQITVVDLVGEGDPAVLREAVCACFQESPTPFRAWTLHDPGAFPEPPLSGKITWRVTHPESEPKSEQEQEQKQRVQALMDRIKRGAAKKQRGGDRHNDD
jgi:tetrahydromethanopterin S-methyltransferase subunit A